MLPGQRHPNHYHKRKEETFQVLYGVLESEIDGHRRTLHPGETALEHGHALKAEPEALESRV